MKKFISKIQNNIEKIIISSFSPTDLGFDLSTETFENDEYFLNFTQELLYCQIKTNLLENEKQLVRIFVDEKLTNLIFIGTGKEVNDTNVDGYLIVDHVNMSGKNPLRGPNDDTYGVRFPDMGGTYKNQIPDEKLSSLNLGKTKLLVPKNVNNLSSIEKEVLEKYGEINIISDETYYGIITAKHSRIPVELILLKKKRR